MIAGPVKQRLCVTPGSRQEIPYTFIPLQTGAVTMPALDLVETVANTAIDGTAAAISLSHEIVVRNHWRRPNVLPSRSAAVFWIADKEVRRPALGAQSEAANTGELLLAVEESSGSQQQAGVANASIIRSQSVISFGTPALDTMANPNGVPGGSIQRPPQTPIPLERIAETPLSAAVGDLLSPAFIKSMTSSLNVRNFRPRRGWWATSTNALGELKGQMQRAIDRRPFVTGQQQQTTASPKPTNSPTGSKAVTTPATASPTEENIVLQ
jgi:hypothetical protein